MGEVVTFPDRRKTPRKTDKKLYYVAVTTILPWEGTNPEHAATEAAKSLGYAQEQTADFYGPSVMTWGPVTDAN